VEEESQLVMWFEASHFKVFYQAVQGTLYRIKPICCRCLTFGPLT